MTQQTYTEYVSNLNCQWFAKCENTARGLVHHPIIGMVPTCKRCLAIADQSYIGIVSGVAHLAQTAVGQLAPR